MKLRPLNDRILVKRVAEEEKTKGGIIIPDTAKEKPAEGKVVAVGKGALNPEVIHVPCNFKRCDQILFGKYGGQEIKVEGEEYMIMSEQ